MTPPEDDESAPDAPDGAEDTDVDENAEEIDDGSVAP